MPETEGWRLSTHDAISMLQNPGNADEIFSGMLELREIYSKFKSETGQCQELSNEVASLNFAGLCEKVLRANQPDMNIRLTLSLLHSFSDSSKDLCKSIMEKDIHTLVVTHLLDNRALRAEILNRKPYSERALEHTEHSVFILNNVLWNYPESRPILRKTGLKYALRGLLDVKDKKIRFGCLLCLSYVIDVDEHVGDVKLLKRHVEFGVKHILIRISEAETDDGDPKWCNSYEDFSSEEIMEPLSIFATDSHNASELIKQGILSVCESILERVDAKSMASREMPHRSQNKAALWVLKLLRELCKHPFAAVLIAGCGTRYFEDLICKFKSHPIEEIAANANELEASLENIVNMSSTDFTENLNNSSSSSSKVESYRTQKSRDQIPLIEIPEEIEKHIMISYCREQQPVAKKLRESLQKNDIKPIWIDYKDMHKGDGLYTEMAKAVDNAKFVICCLSDAYHKSQNCMKEIKYASIQSKNIIPVVVEPKYTPKKELLLIIGDKFRFDFSTDSQFDLNFSQLLEKLAPEKYIQI